MKTQEFLLRVELPNRSKWRRDPTQVAFTIKNVVQSWIEQSVTGKPKVTIQTLKKFTPGTDAGGK